MWRTRRHVYYRPPRANPALIPVHEPALGPSEGAALLRCVEAGDAGGHSPTVHAFEEAFAARVGSQHALAAASGTAALHLAFAALGIGAGDEVIVPSFTFAPCADMVNLVGATPVLVDVDPVSFGLTSQAVLDALTPRSRAVLAVHMYGHPCDLGALAEVCRANDLLLVEDCAQGLGAFHAGRPVGSVGAASCYSFYANKVITTGEGGMVTTDDADLAGRLRWLQRHAQIADPDHAYVHTAVGFNDRMSAFAAAVGIAQLGRLDEFLERKAANTRRYTEALDAVPGIQPPAPVREGDRHANWAYALRVDPEVVAGGAQGLAGALRASGVETRGFYHPLHLHPGAAGRSRFAAPLAACEAFAPNGLVLPSGSTLAAGDVDQVTATVARHVAGLVTS